LTKFANNSPAADFHCAACQEEFELKGKKGVFGKRILDGAYGTMRERLKATNNPNLVLLNYSAAQLAVTNLLVIPKHFFSVEVIQERKPLAATARRAGWVGCNILLDQIPAAGRIYLVRDGQPQDATAVMADWQRTLFLRDTKPEGRGWLIEVMRCVEAVGKPDFGIEDVYRFEDHLRRTYPDNQHVRAKIRQQLQLLRDNGFLEFVGRGQYRLRQS
jgi:type II restriction enzyme